MTFPPPSLRFTHYFLAGGVVPGPRRPNHQTRLRAQRKAPCHGFGGPQTKSRSLTAATRHSVLTPQLWSGHLGQQKAVMTSRDSGAASCVCISEDADYVVVGYHEGHVKAYDVTTGRALSAMWVIVGVVAGALIWTGRSAHIARIRCALISQEEMLVLTGGEDALIQVGSKRQKYQQNDQ